VIAKRLKDLDIASKVNIKTKLQEIVFLEKTSIYTSHDKVKIKGVVKMARPTKFMRLTKRVSSYLELKY